MDGAPKLPGLALGALAWPGLARFDIDLQRQLPSCLCTPVRVYTGTEIMFGSAKANITCIVPNKGGEGSCLRQSTGFHHNSYHKY